MNQPRTCPLCDGEMTGTAGKAWRCEDCGTEWLDTADDTVETDGGGLAGAPMCVEPR